MKARTPKTWARRFIERALCSGLLSALFGCVTPPPGEPKVETLQGTDLRLSGASRTPELAQAWWRAFGDARLDALVETALAANPGLQAAASRVERANALTDAAGASGRPLTGIGLDATRQRFTEHGMVPPPVAGSVRSVASAQAGLLWELDFFGRNQAQLSAALGMQRAAGAEREAAAMVLGTQVVRGYIGLARLLEQRDLLHEQLAMREQATELMVQRAGAGLDSGIELRQAQTVLPELRRQRAALEAQIALSRHQLAALSAQPIEALDALAPAMPVLPPSFGDAAKARLGLDLLGRRPDVSAARWRVEAATQGVAAARAQFYPNLSLSAFIGVNALGLDQLLRAGSLQAGAGPALRLPIFDTGRLRAQLRGNLAELDEAVASYNASVMRAVQEASDALSSVQSLKAQIDEQDMALLSATAARRLIEQRRNAGMGNELAMLNAELGLLTHQRTLRDLRAQWLDGHIALLRALGGGWQPPP